MPSHIGTLSEKSLHAALKDYLAQPGDAFEIPVEGFVIDIVRDGLLIEIQTGGFTPLKRKFAALLAQGYPIHLVHPIAAEKWIVKETEAGQRLERRKSPRRGQAVDVFGELVRIPHLLPNPNLTIEVLLIRQEEIRRNDGQGSWRRKGWSLHDHHLLETVRSVGFSTRQDYLRYIPTGLPRPFTNRDLAESAHIPIRLAQKMTYSLHHAGWLARDGRDGSAHRFTDRT